MRLRTSATIWSHTLFEMWRLILMTTAILVTIIAFAATVKYIAEGRLGAIQALRFMVLAMLPMLQYALPFAAGFGTTLAYHRMASDNELTAAHAGGVSHRSLLGPAVASGLLLALLVSSLSEQAIPRFLRAMEEMISRDAARIIVSSVESGRSIEMDNFIVHADGVGRLGPDPKTGASERLLLTGVVAVGVDERGRVDDEADARRAWVYVYPNRFDAPRGPDASWDRATTIVMRLEDGSWRRSDGTESRFDSLDLREAIKGGVRDDPKFLTWGELRALRTHPERMNWIEGRRRNLARALARRMTSIRIFESLQRDGRATFTDALARPVDLLARSIRYSVPLGRWIVYPAQGRPVAVDARAGSGLIRYEAQHATMRLSIPEGVEAAGVQIQIGLDAVRVFDPARPGAGVNEQARVPIGSLALADDPLDDLISKSSAELLEQARPRIERERPDLLLLGPATELKSRLDSLMREITSKQHERVAMSVNCFVMVLAGAVIAMRLRGSLPLTVYLWSFFPALLTVITISAGQQWTHRSGSIGLVMLWGGVGLMSLYTAGAYVALRRH